MLHNLSSLFKYRGLKYQVFCKSMKTIPVKRPDSKPEAILLLK